MKIFNWVGGSFFRTLGRFLFYAIFGTLLAMLFKDNVFADEYNPAYITNYDVPMRTEVTKISPSYVSYNLGTGSMGDIVVNQGSSTSGSTNIWNRSYQYTTSQAAISNGSEIWIETNVGLRNLGNLYSYQMLVCTNKGISNAHDHMYIGLTSYSSYYFPQSTYKTQTWTAVDENVSWYTAASNITNCYLFSGYGVYKANTNAISLQLTGKSSLSNVTFYIMGYKITDLGYYKENLIEDITEAIENNMQGVATKSDIASVNAKIQQTNQAVNQVNDSINNSDTSGANSDASGFFDNFQSNDHGLTGIITTPLNLINSITSSSCTPLTIPLPFVNQNLTLPCMSTIYSQYFGTFYTIYQTVTFGIVAYWVCVRIFYKVQDFKNPSNSEVEVLEL